MSHPFGTLLTNYRSRKHGLSQARLAEEIGYDPAVITLMCKGRNLTGAVARERVVALLAALQTHGVITTVDEANALLQAAGMADLNEKHSAEANLLQVLRQDAPSVSNNSGPLPVPASRPDEIQFPFTLPVYGNSFIMRSGEVADLVWLLDARQPPQAQPYGDIPVRPRLITLTGTGGCGKTRLAVEVASSVAERFADGVWMVELAGLHRPALVVETVVSVLQIHESPNQTPLETLQHALCDKHLLLILDNCEHVLDACAALAERLLGYCPQLHILATSRERLNIAQECVWPVTPLAVPDLHNIPPVAQLLRYEAIRLFVERAQAVYPHFRLGEDNARSVAEICCHLDGIPLAIELAAARMRVVTAEQVAARLDNRFQLLSNGNRTVLPRHQTLRAAFEWSYDLLAEPEKILFRRLAVFTGPFTLEAAEQVSAGQEIDPRDILDLLSGLVTRSLVEAVQQQRIKDRSGTYFRLLETIREYALEKLRAAHEEAETRTRHLDWYLQLVEMSEPELQGNEQALWVNYLELKHDNLRSALGWALQRGEVVQAARLAGALYRFWELHTHYREGLNWLTAILERNEQLPPAIQMKVVYGAGVLALRTGETERATKLFDQALRLAHTLDDTPQLIRTTVAIAMNYRQQGAYRQAEALLNEGLAPARATGNPSLITSVLNALSYTMLYLRKYEEARRNGEEGLTLARVSGLKLYMAYNLRILGLTAMLEGDDSRAEGLVAQALALFDELDDLRHSIQSLQIMALLHARCGEMERAVLLLSAVEYQSDQTGVQLEPLLETEQRAVLNNLYTTLGADTFTRTWLRGQTLPLKQAIDTALRHET